MIFKIFKATCETGDVDVRVDVAELEDVLVRGAPATSVVVHPSPWFALNGGKYGGSVTLTLEGEPVGTTVYRAGTVGPRVDHGAGDRIAAACRTALLSVAEEVAEFVRGATREVLVRGLDALRGEEAHLEAELVDVRRRIAAASELAGGAT